MEEHYPYSPPSVAGGRSAPPQEPPASVEQGGSKWLVILLSIVALATMIWALAYTSIWYLDLFYQEPWFDEEPIDASGKLPTSVFLVGRRDGVFRIGLVNRAGMDDDDD